MVREKSPLWARFKQTPVSGCKLALLPKKNCGFSSEKKKKRGLCGRCRYIMRNNYFSRINNQNLPEVKGKFQHILASADLTLEQQTSEDFCSMRKESA